MKLIQGTLEFEGAKIVYHIVLLDQCVYIYIGRTELEFAGLSYAIQTKYEEQPTAATLISVGEDEEVPERIAEKLSNLLVCQYDTIGMKLKMPVALSLDIPPALTDAMFEAKLCQLIFNKVVPMILSQTAAKP